MKVGEISKEIRDIMKFKRESFKKIEEFEKTQDNPDLIQYARDDLQKYRTKRDYLSSYNQHRT